MKERVRKLAFVSSLVLIGACAKNGLSDRDVRRSQLTSAAEIKRRELMIVAGNYLGQMNPTTGPSQSVQLKLEIKDIPTPVEGQVDPVMTPILTGYMRFNFAQGSDTNEYIGFAVQKAEFDPNRNKLDIVLTHQDYKDIIVSLEKKDDSLKGTWTAPAVASSGTLELTKSSGPVPSNPGDELGGEYGGTLSRDGALYQFGHLTLQTSFQPPDGLKVSGTIRLIFGDWTSTEYLTYRFDQVQFNPVSGQIVFKNTESDVQLSGHWGRGEISGEWYSSYTGKMGKFRLKKNLVPSTDPNGTLFEALRGTYQGTVKNTNPGSNLPEQVQISFVTSQDLTQPNGIKVTGNLRFYLGPFDSTEYVELPFTDLQHNFYTQKLVAKTSGEYKLTLKADLKMKSLTGTVYSDALGEVADVEMKKQ